MNTSTPQDCNDCARCCTWEIEVFPVDNVPGELTEYMDSWKNPARVMKRSPKANACVALDLETLKCSIYNRRPTVCREFELGEAGCLQARNFTPVVIKSASC